MKIEFEFTKEKHYIDLLPQISFSWLNPPTLYIGWLLWNIIIEF